MGHPGVIALVTATIHDLVAARLQNAVAGATIRIGNPPVEAGEDAQASLCLHRLSALVHQRNDDLPTRQPDGSVAKRPTAAVALHYLLSFDARDALTAQAMLGSALATLHAVPRLTEDRFEQVLRQDRVHPALQGIPRHRPVQAMSLMLDYPLEDAAWTLWGAFRAAPRPALHIVASPVLIEADIPAQAAQAVSAVDLSIGISNEE
jgi:hypothetical protein